MGSGISCFGESSVGTCELTICLGPKKVVRGLTEMGKLAADNGDVHERVEVPGRGGDGL
jgi:hypothetical protein